MSFIQPNSDIKLLHQVPLEPSYEHSICFTNETNQYNYFNGLAKFSFQDYSYQRVGVGVIKVEKCADDIYDCNYLMFRNTSFGTKWFYAFITHIEYINNVTSAVYYELDVLQSWLFNFQTESCFVEREMPVDDYANEQLVPESLETGEYVVSHFKEYDDFMTPLKICVLVTNVAYDLVRGMLETDQNTVKFNDRYGKPSVLPSTEVFTIDITSSTCGNLPIGVVPLFFPNTKTGRENLSWYIALLQDRNDTESVLNMFLVPKFASAVYTVSGVINKTVSCNVTNNVFDYKIIRPLYVGDSNKPRYQNKNMKLYNYPYTFVYISDGNGNMQTYRPELFTDKSDYFNFTINWALGGSAEMLFVPKNYKGMRENYNESYVFNKFPQISWTTDFFKEYWAKNKVDITASLLGNIVSGGNAIASGMITRGLNSTSRSYGKSLTGKEYSEMVKTGGMGNYASGRNIANMLDKNAPVLNAIAPGISIAQTLGNIGIAHQTSDKNHGTQSSDTLTAYGNCHVFSGVMTVTAEMGQVIDEYFSRFGYATHLTKVPNWRTNYRPHWNYVKTQGATITGSMPQDDLQTIVGIFDNGITWWRYGDEIGHYELNNLPVNRGQYRP